MMLSFLGIACTIGICTTFLIFYVRRNKLIEAPEWPTEINGFSYSPFRNGQNPLKNKFPTVEEIREDLRIISGFTKHIRIYSVEGTLRYIPELAGEFGLQVTLGIWISRDEDRNEREIALSINLANIIPSIVRVLVGNESLFRHDISEFQMLSYLRRVRSAVNVPVSTSGQWHIWTDFPELAEYVDFIAAHVLPFWENVPVADAPAFVIDKAHKLRSLFPQKPLLLSEIGWPSEGGSVRQTKSSQADQSAYLRFQVHELNKANFQYFVIEAFDQAWKKDEGSEGPHWGVFNTQRTPKLVFSGAIPEPFRWQTFISQLIAGLRSGPVQGKHLLLLILACHIALLVAGYQYSQQLPLLVCLPLTFLWATATIVVVGVEFHEFIETAWTTGQSRFFAPMKEPIADRPKVSIHVPCFNEPPDMVKITLNSLAELNYENFEVLVIDNNTQDP